MPIFASLRPAARRTLAVASLAVALLATNPAVTTSSAPSAEAAVAAPRTATATTEVQRVADRVAQRRAVVNQKTLRAFAIAKNQKGDPYRWGATGPNAFDCSGLTSFAYHNAGLRLPRTSAAQAASVRHIKRSNLKPGDLMFFSSGGRVYHVGLYAGSRGGHRYILHAPRPGKAVRTERVWTNSWFAGTRRI